MIPELLAARATEYFLLRFGDGFVEKLGADAKDHIQGLFQVIKKKIFFDVPTLKDPPKKPEVLQRIILEQLSLDSSFRQELEKFVTALDNLASQRHTQKIEVSNNQGTTTVVGSIQNNSGVIGGTQNTYNFR